MSVWGPNKGLTQVKNDSFKSTVSCVLKCVGVCVSRSVVSDSLQPHGLWPARLLCSWNSPGKNTGVGSHFPPGDFPDLGIEPTSPEFQVDSLPFEPQGKYEK